MGYDFSGWASRNNLRCGDGRIIRPGAFAKDDGKTVPLVYQHDHENPENVIGTATLENRPEGVYCYGKFNSTPRGQLCKTLVKENNLDRLSIYANHLTPKNSPEVQHGMIREVSLVLAGANPGAVVVQHDDTGTEEAFAEFEVPILEHSDGSYSESEDEAIITMPYHINLDPQEEATVEDTQNVLEHADNGTSEGNQQASGGNDNGPTLKDVWKTLSKEQQELVYTLIGIALKEKGGASSEGDTAAHDDLTEGENTVKFNVFEQQGAAMTGSDIGGYHLTQDDFNEIKSNLENHGGKLSKVVQDFALQHADDYGIKDIETLFPDATDITNSPQFIKRETDWVGVVMSGTHHSPFSKIRMRFADITADEARAKGYIKGDKKVDEVFTLLQRETEPCTIYKRQRIDRDDTIDITSFDVIAFIKSEMRIMYDEELARAVLVGDGRPTSSRQKIKEDHIRPIAKDDDLYTIKVDVKGTDPAEVAKNFVDEHVIAMDDYKGSGNVTMFIRQDLFTRLMLLKDGQGYRLYKSPAELASALMVDKIQKVPNDILQDFWSVSVDLKDYTIGADKGGALAFFSDFDIDYNQMIYLYESRQSGSLTVPKSAIAMKRTKAGSGASSTPKAEG